MAFNLFNKSKKGPKPPKAKEAPVKAEEKIQEGPSIQIAVGTPVLKSFHVSEKSTRGLAMNHYTFVVADKATKTDVKHAVQRAFKVEVTDVHMISLPSKKRRIGRWMGTKKGIRKAVVTLKAGQSIAQAQP